MAQIIKHRRGNAEELGSTTLYKGEMGVTTGSNVAGGLANPIVHIGDGANAGGFVVGRLQYGTSTPNISSGYNATLNDILFYNQHNNKLERLHQSGNETLDLFGNLTSGTISGSVEITGMISASGGITASDIWASGDIHAVGNITFEAGVGGTITLGDSAADNVVFGADIQSNIIPDASDSYDLGSTGQRWNNLWMSGSLTANGGPHSILSATTIDLDAEGALTLDGGSISIGTDADVVIDIDSSTFDVDASGVVGIDSDGAMTLGAASFDIDADGGAITIDGTSTIGIGTATAAGNISIGTNATAREVTIGSNTGAGGITLVTGTGGIDVDAQGDITVDAGTTSAISLDASAASNFTTTAGALTLNGAGGVNIAGNAAEIDITTSAAVDINSGAFTLNGSTVGIDGTGVLTMGASEMNIDADGGAIDIDATTTITVGGTNATAVSIGKSNTTVSIPGSLDVNGTLTTIDTTNLRVADRFIQVASGSTTGDGGIIVTTAANGSGSALFWDDSATRWGLTGDGETGDSQIAATPRQFAVSVSGSAVSPVGSNPSDFGASAATRIGMMHVNTATGDIFIFS